MLVNKKRVVVLVTTRSDFVVRPGFEPRQTEPKSVVLPLYYRAACSAKRSAKIGENSFVPKFQTNLLKNKVLTVST